MTEEWRVISENPMYSISNTQKIKNNKTGRILKSDLRGCVHLYAGSRGTKSSKSTHKLYLQYFCGFPEDSRGRTKIRVLETGEVYYSYKEVCDAIGAPYDCVNDICWAVYKLTKYGTKRKVYGHTFELVEESA